MEDTIAAVATAYGEGGIGIIRISGDEAKTILDKIFVPKTESSSISKRQFVYGHIVDPVCFEVLDEVLAVYMKAPGTYTREDVVEINCHGSIVSLRNILSLVLRCGARLAEPGEFTKRAFLNGRLDLSQAEAVIDMIKAKTDKCFDAALGQLEGKLSCSIREIREHLRNLLVKITVNLDYPDEDIEEVTYEQLSERISLINDMIENLLSTADTGRIIRDGLSVAIVGAPNVGKSSLMNALLRESRAIVTEIPGTTRDTIEEIVSIRGIPVKLTDTAGIRETEDVIEKLGIEKSKEAFNKADLIFFVIDGSSELSEADKTLIETIGQRKVIVLINKADLGQKVLESQILMFLPNAELINTAITRDEGLSKIEEKIEDLVYGGQVKQNESPLITSVRHRNLLERASSALYDAGEMAGKREALDFIEIDIRSSFELLGEIIGETATEEIINEVFANFCLGK